MANIINDYHFYFTYFESINLISNYFFTQKTVRLHDSIQEENYHYLVFDLWVYICLFVYIYLRVYCIDLAIYVVCSFLNGWFNFMKFNSSIGWLEVNYLKILWPANFTAKPMPLIVSNKFWRVLTTVIRTGLVTNIRLITSVPKCKQTTTRLSVLAKVVFVYTSGSVQRKNFQIQAGLYLRIFKVIIMVHSGLKIWKLLWLFLIKRQKYYLITYIF